MISPSSRPPPRRARSAVSQDTRGSILLPALAMVAVLVLGVMHIAQTFQDVLGRIAVQTQADGAALEGAIWHAQGMNLLVTLNIVMACIFALFVAIRLVVLGLAVLLAVVVIGSALLSVVSFGTAGAAGAQLAQLIGRALYQVQSTERRVAKPIMNALKVTTNAERVVSAAVPWVAAALPVSRTSGNEGALVFSVSMLPNNFEALVKDWPSNKKKAIPATAPAVGGMKPRTQLPARMGSFFDLGADNKPDVPSGRHRAGKDKLISRMVTMVQQKSRKVSNGAAGASKSGPAKWINRLAGSLPAQDEDLFMVCSRSAEAVAALVTKVLLGPLDLNASSVETFNSTFGKTIGSIPTIACTPMDELGESVQGQITEQVGAKCKEEKETWEKSMEEGVKHRKNKPWTKGQQLACEKKHKDEATKALGKGRGSDGGDVDVTKDQAAMEDIKTAALWGLSKHPRTSPLLHVWSINPSDRWPYVPGDAEAEFRHVCAGDNDKDGRTCADNALWRYGWFANTVPLRSLGEELGQEYGEMLQGAFNRAMGKAIQGVLGRLASYLPARFSQGGGLLGVPAGSPGPGKHAAARPSVQDLLTRNLFSGWRHPEVANGYWNRKVVGPMTGNWIGSGVGNATQSVFH